MSMLFSSLKVSATSPATREATPGIIPLSIEISNATGKTAKVTIATPNDGPRTAEKIAIADGRARVDAHLNSHLLPNGKVAVAISVEDEAAKTARSTIDLQVSNTGPLADSVRRSLKGFGSPFAIFGKIDSSAYDIHNESLLPWFDRPGAREHIARLRAENRIDEGEAKALEQFITDGYAILPEPLDDRLVAAINSELDDAIARKVENYEYGSSQRIHNLHLKYPGVRALWRHPQVMRFLELIFEVPARPCQTLTYVFGSQQGPHQDTIHLTPFPAGYMCGVWAALEDVQPDSGELEVYRGSHKYPRVYVNGTGCAKVENDNWQEFGEKIASRWGRMLAENQPERIVYRPKKGQVLVWHENLLHGGTPRVDQSLSRRSIVSHYFADGSIAFYDSTGMPGHMA
jgi:hypothetical protein